MPQAHVEKVNTATSPAAKAHQAKLGSGTANEQLIKKLYDIAEQQDAEKFADLFADDGQFWDVSAGMNYYGKDTGKVVDLYAKSFPDMHRELYSMWSVGDMVFVELALVGKQKGDLELAGGVVAPTGHKINTPCFDVFKIKDGKVLSFHCYTAATQLFGQLGILNNIEAALKH